MESYLVISSKSDRVQLEHCLLYDYEMQEENGYRKRQTATIRPPESFKQNEWFVPVSCSPTQDTINRLVFRLFDQNDRELGLFTVNVGFNESYLPWFNIVAVPRIEQHSGNNWNNEGFEKPGRSALFSSGTSTTATGYIDRAQRIIPSGHEVSVVARRRGHVPGDPPIPKAEALTQSLQHYYIYTLSVSIDGTPPRLALESPHPPATASPSPRFESRTSRRTSTLDLAGIGSLFSRPKNELDQPHHVESSDSMVTSLNEQAIRLEQTSGLETLFSSNLSTFQHLSPKTLMHAGPPHENTEVPPPQPTFKQLHLLDN